MDLYALVQNIDLVKVEDAMVSRGGLERHAAVSGADLYRKFLYLKLKYPQENLVPPKLADEAWHEHMMHSEKYMSDCNTLCGTYIHHNPDVTEADKTAGWARTKDLFQREFAVNLDQQTEEGFQVAGNCM